MIGESGRRAIAGGWEGGGVDAGILFRRALPAALPGIPVAPPAAGQAAVIVGAANALGNAYTFTLTDSQNLISASIEAQITACAHYVIGLVSHYVAWQGTIDFVVDIRPAWASPYPQINGILPSVAQIGWDGTTYVNQTLEECLTGIDSDTSRPDAGCTIYLAGDGTIRNYGVPVWFDPNPQFGVDPNVPAGTHDFTGIYTHEIFHSFGFYEVTQQWRDQISTQGNISYFEGATAVSLFGGAVPFAAGTEHYGYTQDPAIPISRGLMFQWGNYERNRFDIGRIDLAILADLGHSIKTYDGLALFELIDTQLNLTGSGGADRLYGDYHANTLIGGGGNDLLDGGAGNDIYHVDSALDAVVEAAGGGSDTIIANASYTLGAGQEVELLRTYGSATTIAVNLTGNAFANSLAGNAAANVLDGKGGTDSMWGYAGNDTYYVDNAGDRVAEAAGGGSDWVIANVSYTLATGQQVELLTTYGSVTTNAINLTGNELANTIVGNDGANMLNGKGGADVMWGYAGNDTYFVDNAADSVTEAAAGGSDVVVANVSYTLAANQEIETLRTYGSATTVAINLAGNGIANTLVGNAAANVLDGKGGNDTLWGYVGVDMFAFTTALGPANIDRIADFQAFTDKIGLDDAVFAGLAPGALDANAFVVAPAAQDAGDRIVYNGATGWLFYDPDGTGGGAAIAFALFSIGTPLVASDFIVI